MWLGNTRCSFPFTRSINAKRLPTTEMGEFYIFFFFLSFFLSFCLSSLPPLPLTSSLFHLLFIVTPRFSVDDGILMFRVPFKTFLELVDAGLFQLLGYCAITANGFMEGIELEQG